MLNITQEGNSVKFTGTNNKLYPDNGVLTVPFNSLILVIDESDVVTFRSVANNDVYCSGKISDIRIDGETVTKQTIISAFDEIANQETGGGGEQVQANWNESDSTSPAYIQNKPTNVSSFTNDAGYLTTVNEAFPSGWSTTGTMSDLITDINEDSNAHAGDVYLDTVSFSDLPSGLIQAELKAEIMSEEDGLGKVILFTVTSTNTTPYHWEYTSAYGAAGTWRSWATISDLATLFDGAVYDSQTKRINFKHGNTILTYIDATAFIKDGMVDSVVISNGNLVITFNTDAGKEPITIPLTDIFNPNNYYTKSATDTLLSAKANSADLATVATSGSYNDLSNKPTIPTVPTNISAFTNDAGYTTNTGTITGITMNGVSKGTSGVVDLGTVVTDKSDKQDTLVSGTNIKTVNNQSLLGSGNLDIQTGGNYSAGEGIDIDGNDAISVKYDNTCMTINDEDKLSVSLSSMADLSTLTPDYEVNNPEEMQTYQIGYLTSNCAMRIIFSDTYSMPWGDVNITIYDQDPYSDLDKIEIIAMMMGQDEINLEIEFYSDGDIVNSFFTTCGLGETVDLDLRDYIPSGISYGENVAVDRNGEMFEPLITHIYKYEDYGQLFLNLSLQEIYDNTTNAISTINQNLSRIEQEKDDEEEVTAAALNALNTNKQNTLVSGTNIKTINNESILGSGNITIQGGGGTTYTAGDGIDITSDVISNTREQRVLIYDDTITGVKAALQVVSPHWSYTTQSVGTTVETDVATDLTFVNNVPAENADPTVQANFLDGTLMEFEITDYSVDSSSSLEFDPSQVSGGEMYVYNPSTGEWVDEISSGSIYHPTDFAVGEKFRMNSTLLSALVTAMQTDKPYDEMTVEYKVYAWSSTLSASAIHSGTAYALAYNSDLTALAGRVTTLETAVGNISSSLDTINGEVI